MEATKLKCIPEVCKQMTWPQIQGRHEKMHAILSISKQTTPKIFIQCLLFFFVYFKLNIIQQIEGMFIALKAIATDERTENFIVQLRKTNFNS